MNILIICCYFHPYNRIASFRLNAFAKYLRSAGYSVTVLAEGDRDETNEWNGCRIHYVKDRVLPHSYEMAIKKRWTVRNITTAILNRIFLDSKTIAWKNKTFLKAKKLFKENTYDIVLSTWGPLSPHLVALGLRRLGNKFYWIADMRDEMSKMPFYSSLLYSRRIARYERQILRKADLVLSVSKPILDDFRSMCRHDRFLEIKNGYDYEEVHDIDFQNDFTMAYFGHFYGPIKPDNWFKAFSDLIAENSLPKSSRIMIVGRSNNISVPKSITANVTLRDDVPHDEAIRISVTEADVLVMVHPLGRKGVYSGKLFDYLATNKPILALCDPEDVIAELLDKTKAGFVADESNIDEIKSKILQCYSIWKNREVLPRQWDKIRQYSRRNQTQILIDYLSERFPQSPSASE